MVVVIDEASLFAGNATAVGPEGFRLLYRFGKGIKNVLGPADRRDRHGQRDPPRAWIISAARGVSVGRFLLDDLSVEPGRVMITAPAPRPAAGGKADRVEFSLEPLADNSRA